jgi:hypothetical protein
VLLDTALLRLIRNARSRSLVTPAPATTSLTNQSSGACDTASPSLHCVPIEGSRPLSHHPSSSTFDSLGGCWLPGMGWMSSCCISASVYDTLYVVVQFELFKDR